MRLPARLHFKARKEDGKCDILSIRYSRFTGLGLHTVESAIFMFTKVALGLVVCFIAVGAIHFWSADPLYLKAPKDRDLITVFQDHRAAFQQLRQMAVEDSIWDLNEAHLDARLDDKRKQEYKRLLSEIRPGLGAGRDYDGKTRFIFAGGGLLAIGPGWAKGIEYVPGSTDRVRPVLENLDQPSSLAMGGMYLRQIGPKWFVFFQKTD
jgi:hypothetical protein